MCFYLDYWFYYLYTDFRRFDILTFCRFLSYIINKHLNNLKGWSSSTFDEKSLNCILDRKKSQSYSAFFLATTIVLPCILILFCFIRTFLHSYYSKVRTRATNKSQSIRLAKALFVSFVLFTMCWLPYGIVFVIDFGDMLPRSAVMYTMTFAHLNSSFNSILYAIFNSSFRRGYIILFRRIFYSRPTYNISILAKSYA